MGRSIIPNNGSDIVATPQYLANDIVEYFSPQIGDGVCLEPCAGTNPFVNALMDAGKPTWWCEISKDRDFFKFDLPVDWIVTNPPYSILSDFLEHSLSISNNVVFLVLGNALFFKKRVRLINQYGFAFKEIVFVDTPPKPWPSFGIQLSVVHLQKNYTGPTQFTHGLK